MALPSLARERHGRDAYTNRNTSKGHGKPCQERLRQIDLEKENTDSHYDCRNSRDGEAVAGVGLRQNAADGFYDPGFRVTFAFAR